MVHIVWEFLVRAERLPEFERRYSGVDGPWAQLFGKARDFVERSYFATLKTRGIFSRLIPGTQSLRRLGCASSSMIKYSRLDQTCEELTENERRVGVFEDWPTKGYKTSTP